MTDADHARWLAYIRDLANRLGLKDWRIELDRDPTVSGLLAHIETTDGARWSVVTFGPTWGVLEPDRQRQALVHELLHMHTAEVNERVREVAARFGDNSLMGYLPDLVRHEIEHAVDAIAEAIAPLLPLPEATP